MPAQQAAKTPAARISSPSHRRMWTTTWCTSGSQSAVQLFLKLLAESAVTWFGAEWMIDCCIWCVRSVRFSCSYEFDSNLSLLWVAYEILRRWERDKIVVVHCRLEYGLGRDQCWKSSLMFPVLVSNFPCFYFLGTPTDCHLLFANSLGNSLGLFLSWSFHPIYTEIPQLL